MMVALAALFLSLGGVSYAPATARCRATASATSS